MLSRRQFIQGGFATLAVGTGIAGYGAPVRASLRQRGAAPLTTRFLSACTVPGGAHGIAGFSQSGSLHYRLPVAERCHGGCARLSTDEAVLFARRPGRHFYVMNARTGELVQTVHAGDDHHFYGHGVFSADGDYLYVTLNHYPSGMGLVRVYEATAGYRQVADFGVGGIGPHELRLHPDGDTLVIALGGIKTHPDYDRVKLNLDTMAPALLTMDRKTGEVRQRYTPSRHQLSCRHLDISPDGVVVAGYQYEGPSWEAPPLIGRLNTGSGRFDELELEADLQSSLANYIASVAVSSVHSHAALTAPRGNRALIVDYRTGRIVAHFQLPDAAGVASDDAGGFIVSSGTGGLYRIGADLQEPQELGQQAVAWDNHLTPLSHARA